MSTLVDLSADIHWITNNQALADACEGWLCCDDLVIDTEFVRRRTFYPIPALIQCYDGHTVYMVDPLLIDDWQAFADVLTAPDVLKVFHACSEDLEVFARLCDVIPSPVFDTQVAAALLGSRSSMGYNALVEEYCGLSLPKDETNSDWLQRPLTTEQVNYAAHDVYYLHEAFVKLHEKAVAQERLDWVLQDSAAYGNNLSSLIEPEQYYLKLKGAWKLDRQGLALARALCAWRELKVRAMDKPRSWVVKDQALFAMARTRPNYIGALSEIDGIPEGVLRKSGKELLALIEETLELPEQDLPDNLDPPLPSSMKEMVKHFKRLVQASAEDLGVSPDVLLSSKEVTRILQASLKSEGDFPLGVSGWRQPIIEPLAKQVLNP